jgi:RNA polymerase sigma-70 factor (ECF subfamily)
MIRDVVLVAGPAGRGDANEGEGPRKGSSRPAAPGHVEPADTARRLAEAYYREIYGVLRRLGVRQEALFDATQHVFLVAAEKARSIHVESERAFVVSVAVRTAANVRRAYATQRERHVDQDVLGVASPAPLADELLDQRRLRSLLDEALDSLPPDLREAFVLFELENLTLAEIAHALDIPRGTVASRLRRARESFREIAARLKSRGTVRAP